MTNRLPAAQRRRQLLDIAVGVFAEHGFHKTAMVEVAAAAGVTKPVVYQHFPSKRALYLEVLLDVGDRLCRTIETATLDVSSPRHQVYEALLAFFRFVDTDRDAFTVLFGDGTRREETFAAAAAEVEAAMERSIASRLLVPGMTANARAILARGIVGMAEAAARQWLGQADPDPVEDVAALVAQVSWSGLRGLSTAQS